ncbi:hypothetical protein, partial [Pseudomonas syringae]|uniref:hypothetical protein n=1 Tax=Pseudomonas syringae TaxID=317 RepID=UPI0034D974CC
AFDLWKETGVADSYISSVLGIAEGSRTMDYIKTQNDTAKTQYDINKPYFNPDSKSEKLSANEIKRNANQSYGEDYQAIKGMSWKDAE